MNVEEQLLSGDRIDTTGLVMSIPSTKEQPLQRQGHATPRCKRPSSQKMRRNGSQMENVVFVKTAERH
jgi:hypothetical protein